MTAPRKARPVAVGPATTVAAARRAALSEALDQIVANAPGSVTGRNPEYLHQLRVGARRLRAALRVFRGTMREADVRTLRRRLRKLAEVTGPARDWDVYSRKRPAARRRRVAAYAALRRVLAGMQLWLLPRPNLRAKLALPEFARGVLEELDRGALRKGARMDWTRAKTRHALRRRLRRLRYASEFVAGAFPACDREPLILSLKALQDLLGTLNDAEVARRLARELGGSKPHREPGIRERALIAQLPGAWRRFKAAPRFWR